MADRMKSASTCLVLWLACTATVAAEKICLIKIDGAIGPATASYISRSIDEAQTQQAQCLVIQLNTPGGLLDSTQTMVKKLSGVACASGGLCRSDGRDRGQCRLLHYHCRQRRDDGAGHDHWCGASGDAGW